MEIRYIRFMPCCNRHFTQRVCRRSFCTKLPFWWRCPLSGAWEDPKYPSLGWHAFYWQNPQDVFYASSAFALWRNLPADGTSYYAFEEPPVQ